MKPKSSSICQSSNVGSGTKIGDFSYIGPDVKIGENCRIDHHVALTGKICIDDNVAISSGVKLDGDILIEEGVQIQSNVVLTGKRPSERSSQKITEGKIRVGARTIIGAQSTILPGVTLGIRAMISPNSVITRSVPAHALAAGNPARVVSYFTSAGELIANEKFQLSPLSPTTDIVDSPIRGVKIFSFPKIIDTRGNLSVLEFESDLPFAPKRLFFVTGARNQFVRGEHAHRTGHQLLICLSGSIVVLVDDGRERYEYRLDKPEIGLYLEPMVWATQYDHQENSCLAVLASNHYDPSDYIRNYEDFLGELDLQK
jgi:UDP-2-acetamido-3-amino-2,3-dideoxy-glucuronate N-acetyltransferase